MWVIVIRTARQYASFRSAWRCHAYTYYLTQTGQPYATDFHHVDYSHIHLIREGEQLDSIGRPLHPHPYPPE